MPYRYEDGSRADPAPGGVQDTPSPAPDGPANARTIQIMIVVGLVAAVALGLFGS